MIKKICVYAASSSKIDPVFFEATRRLAEYIAKDHIQVVYGGGGQGLMGQLATTMLQHRGDIIGIMPHFMREVEWAHKEVKEFIFTEDMHERKKKFLVDTDALIALPGGCGTLEELFEAITLKKLGLYHKPIIILNTKGYYDPLLQMLDRTIEEKFMGEIHRSIWTVVNEPEEVLDAIRNAPPWLDNAISVAAV